MASRRAEGPVAITLRLPGWGGWGLRQCWWPPTGSLLVSAPWNLTLEINRTLTFVPSIASYFKEMDSNFAAKKAGDSCLIDPP